MFPSQYDVDVFWKDYRAKEKDKPKTEESICKGKARGKGRKRRVDKRSIQWEENRQREHADKTHIDWQHHQRRKECLALCSKPGRAA